jgi:hypothetical protein
LVFRALAIRVVPFRLPREALFAAGVLEIGGRTARAAAGRFARRTLAEFPFCGAGDLSCAATGDFLFRSLRAREGVRFA